MSCCYVSMSWHGMSAWVVFGLATLPFLTMRVLQVRFHDDIDGSSLARAIYASTGPLLLPFDSRFPTHSKPLGHDFRTKKWSVIKCVVSTVLCCDVEPWNMVLKCPWRCVACSNRNPRKFHGVQFNFHWRRLTKANHCIRLSGCSANNQRPTKKAGNGKALFLSVLGCDMERGAQISVYMGRGCHEWGVAFF